MPSDRHKHFIGDIPQKAIIDDRGKVLLAKTKRGYWELPGGRLNMGESPRAGLKREIREEVGAEIEPQYIFDVFTFTSFTGMSHYAVIYVCKLLTQPRWMRQKENIGFSWFGKDEIGKLKIRREYHQVLKKFFAMRYRNRS